MATLTDFLTILKRVLQDNASVLTDTELITALEHALSEYSRRRPYRKLHDITGDGSTTLWSLPSGWVEDWSVIRRIESPVNQEPASIVDVASYRLVRDLDSGNTVLRLRFTSTLTSGTVARIEYTAIRAAEDIPAHHINTVATLGAAIAAEWIATSYAQQTDTTLSVDVADRDTRSQSYSSRAERFRESFDAEVPWGQRTMQVVRG